MDIPGMPGSQMGVMNLNEIFGKAFGGRTKTRRLSVDQAMELLVNEESDKLLDQEMVTNEAIATVEQNGIVFPQRAHGRRREPRGGAARSAAAH
jgi:ATP-dependent HslUV protease ATP-binding subunit HslU